MPLDLSISDMPWFGQPANPTAAIESGVRVGATLSSLAKQKREREMEEVRFAQEQHEFKQKDEAFNMNKRATALQMQGQEYENVVLRNKATQTALQTAWEAGNEEAMTKFQLLSYQMITGNKYDDPVLQDELSKLLSSSPRLLQNPESMTIFKMMDDGRQLFETNKQKQASVKPEIMSVPDPETGENISMVRTGPNSWSRVSEQRDSVLQDKVRLAGQTAVRSAQLRGIVDPTQLELIKADAEASAVVPGGEAMEVFDPKTGQPTFRVTRGGAGGKAAADPGALTPTNTTKAQQDFQSGQRLLSATERLIPLISSETFGPQAFINSVLKDDLLGNVFPFLVSGKRQDAAVIAGDVRSAMIQSMKSDSNVAQVEIDKLEKMFPEPSKLLDSPKKAELLTKSVAKLAASRVLLSGKKLGLYSKSKDQFDRDVLPQKIDRAVVKALAYDDIKALYDSGLIDSEILVALKNASDPEMGYGITKEQGEAIYYGKR
jgi:hypothetical protein